VATGRERLRHVAGKRSRGLERLEQCGGGHVGWKAARRKDGEVRENGNSQLCTLITLKKYEQTTIVKV
jgi:hypothetical protein